MRKKPKINILWAELVYLLTPRDEMPEDVLVNGKVGALEPLTKSRDHLFPSVAQSHDSTKEIYPSEDISKARLFHHHFHLNT